MYKTIRPVAKKWIHLAAARCSCFFICALFLVSCQNTPGYRNLALVDSVVVPTQAEPEGYLSVSRSDSIFYVFDPNSGDFSGYNFLQRRVTDTFSIPHLKNEGISFYVADTALYVLRRHGPEENKIERYNRSGVLLNSYSSNTERDLENLYLPFEVSSNNSIFLYNTPRLRIADKKQRATYFNSDILSRYVLSDSTLKLEEQLAWFPKEYKEHLYDEYQPIATALNQNEVAYMYSIEPRLYIAGNKKSSSQVIEIPKNELLRANDDSIIYHSYTTNLALKTETYMKLLHDRKTDRFCVFRAHKIEQNAGEQELAIFKDKPFTIYIVDRQGKVQAARHFDQIGNYNLVNSFCYSGRLYLPRRLSGQIILEVYDL